MVFCIAKKNKIGECGIIMLDKLSISQLANIIQSDTVDFLVGATWGYKIIVVNKCGTASLGYFKSRQIRVTCCSTINDAIDVGSISLLLSNIDNYRKIGQTWPLLPWKRHFE